MEHLNKLPGEVIAGIFGLVLGLLLERRYRRYLSSPPSLPPTEAMEDSRRLVIFRVATIGLFLLGGIMALLVQGRKYL